ncbi:MAG TPA: DUF305 domain-containing protein [Chitinophagaceae bacterium]|jgi:uncharacterized protein (DUF305 family)|nr:DUF305 domain-containing protein [Chitinophagaceae bacterium]
MKRILIAACSAMTILACNSGTDTPESGTAAAHTGGNESHSAQPDTLGKVSTAVTPDAVQSDSMMGLMHRNMNQMKEMASIGHPDHDFAALMKVHHMGAVQMARLLLAQGTDAELKRMAQKMISDQQKELTELDAFLTGKQPQGSRNEAFHKAALGNMQHNHHTPDTTGSIDGQFVQLMIPHHQDGINMARTYLENGATDPKMKAIAQNIIREQEKEIAQLKAWRK